MSRIIVKNLPKKITANELQDLFASKGCITDLQLKYTKSGVFRQFAFVGYKTEEDALAAKEYFHNAYIHAAKVQVDICANLGDANKPRAWSKHSKEKTISNNEKSLNKESTLLENNKEEKKKKSKKSKTKDPLETFPEELRNDSQFKEFLELNKDRKSKPVWCDDTADFKDVKNKVSQSESESSDDNSSSEEEDNELPESKIAQNKQISDMEYLRSKMKSDVKAKEGEESKEKEQKIPAPKVKKVFDDQFTLKVKNLPYLCKKKQIKSFFHPLKLKSIRIPPKSKGFAYVNCKTEKDMKQALNKSKGFLDGHRIDIVQYERKNIFHPDEDKIKQTQESKDQDQESLAESGRIYVRNLCFSVIEEELQALFSKYGPLVETHLPIDSFTKKTLGFAFITFMFSEHAVKAFSELDGTIFQGRLLHLMPAKPKKEIPVDENELSFKQKKEAKIKALSGSSHNWNTLFLGLNAVVDIMAERYKTDKSKLLSCDTKDSVSVRLALGETQLVVETREFLIANGVQLDAFSQAAAERSKTVMIAKNLPAKTSSKEILELFSKHGFVSKVILPPSGITAIIEFQHATEAKMAFQRLAYSRFHNLPLYLEWAPFNVFSTDVQQKSETALDSTKEKPEEKLPSVPEKKLVEEEKEEEEDDDEEPEPETTLFVKNINFETTEDQLRKKFQKCGALHSVSISKKKNIQSGQMLSMGFGFVQYKYKNSALAALCELQHSDLDGHSLELKFSNRATVPKSETQRKKMKHKDQKSSKILVRNIAFEVKEREIRDLFQEFGVLKTVRLPKKFDGMGTHRGFGFVDFRTKKDAKKAFDALCHSTHLLGRRLVLEWANQDTEDVDELRKKTARYFHQDGPPVKVKKSKLMEDVMLASSGIAMDVD